MVSIIVHIFIAMYPQKKKKLTQPLSIKLKSGNVDPYKNEHNLNIKDTAPNPKIQGGTVDPW